VRGEGCGHGSGLLPVRGSDRWAAARGGGHGGRFGQRHRGQRRRGEGCSRRGGRAGAAGAVCAWFRRQAPCAASAGAGWLRRPCLWFICWRLGLRRCRLPLFSTDYVFDFVDYVDPYGGIVAELLLAVISIGAVLAVAACIWGLSRALKTLKAGIRFSRLLRRPNDARTATVMASERGGRTLILDSNPRDGTGRWYTRE
jgi:hypothetical protein